MRRLLLLLLPAATAAGCCCRAAIVQQLQRRARRELAAAAHLGIMAGLPPGRPVAQSRGINMVRQPSNYKHFAFL